MKHIKWIRRLLPPPVQCRHGEYSMLFSVDDDQSHATPELIQIALKAIEDALSVDLTDLTKRMEVKPYFPNVWPGEHYKLLAGLVRTLKPRQIIEIGTGTGMSALCMKKYLPDGSRIFTFDIISYKENKNSKLIDSDFDDKKLVAYVDDLTKMKAIECHRTELEDADIIFIDAAKNVVMERIFLENFHSLRFRKAPLLVFDDIRLWNMLKIWREIDYPKLDLTSFGHWTGTGLVQWKGSP